jgi:hypothetical protein
VALGEARAGRAGHVSAGARGLRDDTSDNAGLFAISAQNNGVDEPWSPALVDAMARCSAVTLEALGLTVGHTTIHRVLTGRKIDTCGPGCPDDWHPAISAATGGHGPPLEVPEMWVLNGECPAGDGDDPGDLLIAVPFGFTSARVDFWLDCDHRDGAALWGSQAYEGGAEAVGLWGGGHVWELWLPGRQRTNTSAIVDMYLIPLMLVVTSGINGGGFCVRDRGDIHGYCGPDAAGRVGAAGEQRGTVAARAEGGPRNSGWHSWSVTTWWL